MLLQFKERVFNVRNHTGAFMVDLPFNFSFSYDCNRNISGGIEKSDWEVCKTDDETN